MPLQTPVYRDLAQALDRDLAWYVLENVPVFHAGLVLDRYLPIEFSDGPRSSGLGAERPVSADILPGREQSVP